MDQALIQVGLPVKCRKCLTPGRVKPSSDYDGWYRLRISRKEWFCPEHAKIGKDMDQRFYEKYKTPEPAVDPDKEDIEELYKLLD